MLIKQPGEYGLLDVINAISIAVKAENCATYMYKPSYQNYKAYAWKNVTSFATSKFKTFGSGCNKLRLCGGEHYIGHMDPNLILYFEIQMFFAFLRSTSKLQRCTYMACKQDEGNTWVEGWLYRSYSMTVTFFWCESVDFFLSGLCWSEPQRWSLSCSTSHTWGIKNIGISVGFLYVSFWGHTLIQ